MSSIRICLDTNIFLFALAGQDRACETIIEHLGTLPIVLPDQVRVELNRNLTNDEMSMLYRRGLRFVEIDSHPVDADIVEQFYAWGLKKGDAMIGAFCESRGISLLISDNRDFLRGLQGNYSFQILSPKQFAALLDLFIN